MVVAQAADTSGSRKGCRPEDRGVLLFTTSMTTVKTTYDACRRAAALMENHSLSFEIRDVFVNPQCAAALKSPARTRA